jgi:hypothetical protein
MNAKKKVILEKVNGFTILQHVNLSRRIHDIECRSFINIHFYFLSKCRTDVYLFKLDRIYDMKYFIARVSIIATLAVNEKSIKLY